MGLTFNHLGVRNSIIHHGGPFVFFTDRERLDRAFRQKKLQKPETDLVVDDAAMFTCKQPALQTSLQALHLNQGRGNKQSFVNIVTGVLAILNAEI